jgi:hypothetical protein
VFVKGEDGGGLAVSVWSQFVEKERKGGFVVCVEGLQSVVVCCERRDGVLCARELGLEVCDFGGACRCYFLC